MCVPKTSNYLQTRKKMSNLIQEPPVFSKAPNRDLKDMNVLCTFKIKIRAKTLNMGLPGVKLMHKRINTQMPNVIYKQLVFPNGFHQVAHIRVSNFPKKVQCRMKAKCDPNIVHSFP